MSGSAGTDPTSISVWTSLFDSTIDFWRTNQFKNLFRLVTTAADQYILTAAGPTVRIQCPGGGIPPFTLFVWMGESVHFFPSLLAE